MTSYGWSQSSSVSNGEDGFYAAFRDPSRGYSIRPFWFWNGDLNAAELRRQMQQMISQGVYGAYAHSRDGLRQRYLSNEWWSIVQAAMDAAEELGFSLCMVDEFEWPSGEARDFDLPGPQKSLVIAANPEFHLKRLVPHETMVKGGATVQIAVTASTVQVLAAKRLGLERLDGDSIRALAHTGQKEIAWTAPDGDWIIIAYELEKAYGNPDRGTVDLLNREAVAEYIRIYYEELKTRCGRHFGKALPATFADHEGTYGGRYPWTPALETTFQKMHGYSFLSLLPALSYDIGSKTEKYRCNLLETISALYTENFFQQVNDWCVKHRLDHSAHVWEESLFLGATYQGDFFSILRAMSNPGCDTLLEWSRQSVWLQENSSVADFERRHVVCENQGVQGADSYLSPERMRRTSNCLGAWNVGEFIPHAFNYDLSATNFPPDWFRAQPYMEWFKEYADQMRRISWMNRDSHVLADILLFYPQTSIWGQTSKAFSEDGMREVMMNSFWSQDAQRTESEYALLKLALSAERFSYQIADDQYLQAATAAKGRLRLADSEFKLLILPPMSTMHRKTAQKIAEFIESGGSVFALSRLPDASPEYGRNDPMLTGLWSRSFKAGQRAQVIDGVGTDLIEKIRPGVVCDCEIVDGAVENLFTLRKRKDGREFYWIVNDSSQPRTNLLRLRSQGKPERWDAVTGLRTPLFYENQTQGTTVRLKLEAWDAAYVVFERDAPPQKIQLRSTNLDDFCITGVNAGAITAQVTSILPRRGGALELERDGVRYKASIPSLPSKAEEITGDWTVSIEAPTISAPYCMALDDPKDVGLRDGWPAKEPGDLPWQQQWLSTATTALKRWNVIGPFPNPEDDGLERQYPPELGFDPGAEYTGDQGQALHWISLDQAEYTVLPERGGRGIGAAKVRGGPQADNAQAIDFAGPLGMTPPRGTMYAQTFVYAEKAMELRLLLASYAPRAIYVNGKEVFKHWIRPFYCEMSDAFTEAIPITLQAGWNSVMLKLINNPLIPAAGHFYCRLATREGGAVAGVVNSFHKMEAAVVDRQEAGFRWLQVAVPPLVDRMERPAFVYPAQVFVDGTPIGDGTIDLPTGARRVMLRVDRREMLVTPFRFRTASGPLGLGSWMRPGLENFSGSMIYEKDIEFTGEMLADGLLLDCGTVGVVAEAWMNDVPLGKRSWSPFVFNLTGHARVGRNRLRVKVANTEANARGVGASHHLLKAIDLDGWHGPARLVPYVSREITLQRTAG